MDLFFERDLLCILIRVNPFQELGLYFAPFAALFSALRR